MRYLRKFSVVQFKFLILYQLEIVEERRLCMILSPASLICDYLWLLNFPKPHTYKRRLFLHGLSSNEKANLQFLWNSFYLALLFPNCCRSWRSSDTSTLTFKSKIMEHKQSEKSQTRECISEKSSLIKLLDQFDSKTQMFHQHYHISLNSNKTD